MRVKLFWQDAPGSPGMMNPTWSNAQSVEDRINAWLAQHPRIRIVEVRQSASGEHHLAATWLFSVWYEETD